MVVWNIRVPELNLCSVPPSRPGDRTSSVLLLQDPSLEQFVRELDLDLYFMFGCDKHHLTQHAYDTQQGPLCEFVKSMVIRHAAVIWPNKDPNPATFTLVDSSMFGGEKALCSGELLGGEKAPMHNVRNGMGYSPEVHLDIDVRVQGLCCSNHVNAWIPLCPQRMDTLRETRLFS